MEFSLPIQRRVRLGGALFGVALACVLLWTTQVSPALALSRVPINAASYGLNPTSLGLVIALNLIGITLGAYLVAHFWDRLWIGLFSGAIATAIVQIGTAYLVTTAALEGNSFAELIMFQLPLGLVFGGALWFVGGMLGSVLERLALRSAAGFFQQSGKAAIGLALVLGAGAALGFLAGGNSEQREQTIAAALAVDVALRDSIGQNVPTQEIPSGFSASGPAREALATLRDQGDRPYQIVFIENDGREIVTVVRYPDGPAVRCVSVGAQISRCFRDQSR